jgi:hypothetical protein
MLWSETISHTGSLLDNLQLAWRIVGLSSRRFRGKTGEPGLGLHQAADWAALGRKRRGVLGSFRISADIGAPRVHHQRPGNRSPLDARLSSQYRADAFASSLSSFWSLTIHSR